MSEVLLKIRPSRPSEEERIRRGPMHMEQAVAALHSLQRHRGAVSLEIAFAEGTIALYARTEEKFTNLVANQIYAQYPDVDITTVSAAALDPREGEEVLSLDLTLKDPHLFPVKRYPQFDDILSRITVDPLSGVTATIASYPHPEMRGIVQLVLQPIGDRYRRRAQRCLPLLNRGLCRKSELWMKTFARLYMARGWARLWATPLAFLMGGYRGIFRVRAGGLDPLDLVTAAPTVIGDDRDEDQIRTGTARSHDRESDVQAALDKVSKLLFDVNLRALVVARPEHRAEAEVKLHEIAGSFKQFELPHLNSFKPQREARLPTLPRSFTAAPFVLNTEEVATIWHLPNLLVKTPNIDWVLSRKLEPPVNLPVASEGTTDDLTVLGEAVFRGRRTRFGIRRDDRRRHIYVIGKTGMGKSVLLQNMIGSDIAAGHGLGVIDPHGDLADAVLQIVPKRRTNDVVVFDPSDTEYPISFNMLEATDQPDQRALAASGIMSVFTKIWPDLWSGRMEHIMRNTLLALIEASGTSMLGIMRMYADASYREKIVAQITDPLVRSFWEDEFQGWTEKYRVEAVAAIQNKVGQLLSTPLLRNILGQTSSSIDLRHAMDTGKIVIVNLSKGKLGEDNAAFLGSMLVTKFQIDAMSRANVREQDRRDFYLYVDEFQNFATPSFASILSEARKYRLNLTMANQYLAQLEQDTSAEARSLKEAVFGNVGTIVAFQVGSEDAEDLALQFGDEKLQNDILSLPKYHAYVRLLVSGIASPPFSVSTLPPPTPDASETRRRTILALSRERYTQPREVVEEKIRRWAASVKIEREKAATAEKLREKEEEERKKAKAKGMSLETYRTWRDREMWTNRSNQLKKKAAGGEALTPEDQKELRELEEKLTKAGGPTVQANLAPKAPKGKTIPPPPPPTR